MTGEGKQKRRRLQIAGGKDFRVRILREECARLNKEAGCVEYHVDHIIDIQDGGSDIIENLWIVPAMWNTLTKKTPEMRGIILDWIQANGRVCKVIPDELLKLSGRYQYHLWGY